MDFVMLSLYATVMTRQCHVYPTLQSTEAVTSTAISTTTAATGTTACHDMFQSRCGLFPGIAEVTVLVYGFLSRRAG